MRAAHAVTAAATLAFLLTGCQSGSPASTPTSDAAIGPSTNSTAMGTSSPATTPVTATTTVTVTATPTTKAAPATPPAAGGLSRSYAEAQRRIQAATNAGRAVDPEVFVTPSRNIICAVVPADATTGAACEIDQGRIRERRCGTGDGARDVGRIVFVRGVPTPECNSDTMFPDRARQPVLPYGWVAHVQQGSVECLSDRAGVTCIDGGSRRGFVLSRGSYRLLR